MLFQTFVLTTYLQQTGGWEELTKKRVLRKRGDKIVAQTRGKAQKNSYKFASIVKTL